MGMNRVWANRLEAGDKTWDNVPSSRKAAVEVILREDTSKGVNFMTPERFESITGKPYSGD